MPRLARDEGIVLATQDFAETDCIVTLLTATRGKLPLLAKGARRLTTPFGAILDPLNRVEVIYYKRQGLRLLREASLVEHLPALRGDLERLEMALAGVRLAARLVAEGEESSGPYKALLDLLRELAQGLPLRTGWLAYVLKMLHAVGHQPHLTGCVRCGAGEELTWSPERGGLLCRRCGGRGEGLPAPLWRSLAALQRLPLAHSARVRMRAEHVDQATVLLEAFADYQMRR
ncbi:TPA: DNA repair protein RecO [Candidatus Acetothermia bacterium]|nr:DNA repair protein RecO [Candidatus Acetothermia bacterium]HAZ30250.1 DNA repair protein RecO [Candidatus Acetothermia bacterium]